MSAFDHSLDDLIRVHRESVGLSERQRARNRARLLSRVTLGVAAGTMASAGAAAALPAKASSVIASSWAVRLTVSMLLAGGAGAAYVVTRPASPSPRAMQPRPAAPLVQPADAGDEQPLESALTSAPAPAPTASSSDTPRLARRTRSGALAAAPSLAAEVQLMRDVEVALRAGQPERALTLLDRHPGEGLLAEERAAAHVVTLCQLGKVEAARKEAAHFLRDHPRSPLAARVRGTCARPAEGAMQEKNR